MTEFKYSLIALTKISLLCLVFFVLFPSTQVQAMFSDTANQNMGIKLELGTVSLATEDTTPVSAPSFTEGYPVLIASTKLINDGSLFGKLGYKINITKEDGSPVPSEKLKETSIIIDFKNVTTIASLNSDFTFFKDASNKDVIMDPNKEISESVTISYKSNAIPLEEEKLIIEVTFRLIQSNASNPNAEMFSDEETVKNTVTLVPKDIDEGSYWPKAETFIDVDDKYSYSLEKMNMVFSETEESNIIFKNIRNLNKAVLYIQFPETEPVITTINGKEVPMFSIENIKINGFSNGWDAIKASSPEIVTDENGIKITFELNDTVIWSSITNYNLDLRFDIKKLSVSNYNYYYYNYSKFSKKITGFATRLFLSTDTVNTETGYTSSPIKLTSQNKLITFKQMQNNSITDVNFSKGMVGLEITEDKNKSVILGEITNQGFNLMLDPKNPNSANFDGANLKVKIKGNTGHTLVISRRLEKGNIVQPKSMRSVEIPVVKEEIKEPTSQIVEQPKDTIIKKEESASTTDSSLPSEQTVEVPLEEAAEEDSVGETEEVVEEVEPVEGIDSTTVESDAELKEETSTKEKSVQAVPKELITDE